MDIRKVIKNRKLRGTIMYGLSFLPDEMYVSLFYKAVVGKFPNLKNPKSYTEKLQWLKLHDKHPEYTKLADKIEVRKHIEEVLGPGYTFPMFGKWKRFEDIDFNRNTKLGALGILLLTYVGTCFVQLLSWSSVGGFDLGISLRYFIPLLALVPIFCRFSK